LEGVGKSRNGDIIEWDKQHGEVERYNPRGKHKGVWDPEGKQIKPPVPGRTIDPFTPQTYNWRNQAASWFAVGVVTITAIIWESSRIVIPVRNLIP